MGAALLTAPELAIDASEAKLLAEAVNGVQEHYNFEASESAMVWANLIGALVAIYGPRVLAVGARKSREKKEAKKKAAEAQLAQGLPAGVVDITAGSGNANR